jgi:hypothetical protein
MSNSAYTVGIKKKRNADFKMQIYRTCNKKIYFKNDKFWE